MAFRATDKNPSTGEMLSMMNPEERAAYAAGNPGMQHRMQRMMEDRMRPDEMPRTHMKPEGMTMMKPMKPAKPEKAPRPERTRSPRKQPMMMP